MFDSLGDRMKSNYENRTRVYLPRRSYTIIRVDGKAFHTYTKGFERPFSSALINLMDETAKSLCGNIMGSKFAYVQSDEISILLTDFDKITTEAWFDGNIQKMCSVSASLATGFFNSKANEWPTPPKNIAFFDSRVFSIPSKTEVENYFIWRQQDCVRNSISSVAQSLYSHKELNGKNTSDMQEMIFQKGINWNDYDGKLKRGRIIIKENVEGKSSWISGSPPTFTQQRDLLRSLIPDNE